MRVLAFDTALGACSAAVWADGEVVASRYEELGRGHAEALMPMVEEVRQEAGIAYDDLDRLAVTIGPGTFTGLRIGLAAARGLGLARALPLAGITTLEAVAAGVSDEARGQNPILVVLDARRDEVYAQTFAEPHRALGEACVIDCQAAADLLPSRRGVVVGTGAGLVRAHLGDTAPGLRFPPVPALPNAILVAAIAARGDRAATKGAPPAPLYLRPPDAKPPRT